MKRLLLVLTMFLFAATVSAFSVGKLTGVVKDKKTGEPIIGANVMIEGTFLGGAADLDGKYTIYNIPVGEYTVIASAVGYQKAKVAKVLIKNNLSTVQNIQMSSEDIMLGEEIVVEAEAPLIQKDLTSSAVTVSASELRSMPVENIGQVVNMQAGVVDGHFRGGRRNEVAYLLDGVPITDAFSSGEGLSVQNSSVRQLEVISGTFNAEYGQAMSGIINVVSNDGAVTNHNSWFSSNVGSYYSTDPLYPNIDRVGLQSRDFQGSVSGPLSIVPGMSYFMTGRYFFDQGSFYGRRVYRPKDADPFTNPFGQPTGDSAWVPMAPFELYSWNGKLTWQSPMYKLSLNTLYEQTFSQGYSHVKKYSPDGRMKNFKNSLVSSLQFTHIPTDKIFHVTSVTWLNYNYNGRAYEDPFSPMFIGNGYGDPPSNYTFSTGGTDNSRYKRFTNTMITKWQLTAQLNDVHKLGVGLEARHHNLFTRNSYLFSREFELDADPLPDSITFEYSPLHTDGNSGYQKIPWEFSAYIQDKIEYDIMIVNLGLRFEYFQPNTKVVQDFRNPDQSPFFPGNGPSKDAEAQYQISPRLGVSFPITADGVIHFSYGHFFQIPPFENIYQNNDLPVYTNQTNISYGNGNLKAQKTVMYELGLQQVLPYDIKLDANMYYRDIRNLIGVEIVNTYYGSYYSRFINKDYGNVRGLTISLDRRMSDMFSVSLDYTYQNARGNASDPYSAIYYYQSNLEPEKQVRPLDWDQRQTVNLILTAGSISELLVSANIGYGSGFPYTPDVVLERSRFLNEGTKPTTWNFDLRAERQFDFAGTSIGAYVLIYNVLGIKNEYGIFPSTGRATRDLLGEQQWRELVGDKVFDDYISDPSRFSGPRNIKVGFNFSL